MNTIKTLIAAYNMINSAYYFLNAIQKRNENESAATLTDNEYLGLSSALTAVRDLVESLPKEISDKIDTEQLYMHLYKIDDDTNIIDANKFSSYLFLVWDSIQEQRTIAQKAIDLYTK